MHLIVKWLIAAVSLWLTVSLGKKLGLDMRLEGATPAVLAVLVLAVANAVLGNILKLLTLPISCLTLGLFGFIVNALIFWLVGGTGIIKGFEVNGFFPSLFGSVVMGIICGTANRFVNPNQKKRNN